MPLERITKPRIIAALKRLGELAAEVGVRLEMTIYGGAAMMLAFNSRESTKDVDAIVHPRSVADRLAAKVATEQNLHENWMNDDVKQFVSDVRENKHPLFLEGLQNSHLSITRPTGSYLLAMKAMACRPRLPGYEGDMGDLKVLIRKMEITSVAQIQSTVDKYFTDSPLPPASERLLKTIIDEVGNETKRVKANVVESPKHGMGGCKP